MSMAELVRTCFMAAPLDVFHHEMAEGMNDREVRLIHANGTEARVGSALSSLGRLCLY